MRVLIVDDDPPMRDLLVAAVVARGHEVATVADGAAAWIAMVEAPPALVLLDWLMPALDGHALLGRIRGSSATRNAFVLMVTVRDAADDLAMALDAGADDYLQKPFTLKQLSTRLTIAERRIAQDDARRHAQAELARAQWLAGIGQTALAVQHEINNPLAALLGSAALLTSGRVSGDESAVFLRTIMDEAMRIAQVVRRLAELDSPRTVDYVSGRQMLDLRGPGET
jgi:DNA-binding response OmpR family regulator